MLMSCCCCLLSKEVGVVVLDVEVKQAFDVVDQALFDAAELEAC